MTILALKDIHAAAHPARLERREEADRIELTQPNRLLKRLYDKEALREKAQTGRYAQGSDHV